MKPEIRKDYIQEKYVLIAPVRGRRKHDFMVREEPRAPKTCFFCPQNLKKEEIIKIIGQRGKTWEFAVLKNLFPAVSKDNPRAYGAQELIVETPHPNNQLEDLPTKNIAKLLKLYAERTRELKKDKRLRYILIFKNFGGGAGATITHSHSQIFASEFLPPHLLDKSKKVSAYKKKNKTCVYCDVIKKEREGPRFVAEKNGIIAFAPYASMHQYELWILPKRHLDNITELNPTERLGWGKLLKDALAAIARLGLSYNFYFHEVVFDPDMHFYMKITPRGSVWAGLEIGSGLVINSVPPEQAAVYYRKQITA